jgi:hypothetical protein
MLGEIYMYLSGNYVYHILLPGEFGFLATVAIASGGVTWVLRRKNRSPALLLFFLPVLIIAVIAQVMTIEYYADDLGNPAVSITTFFASVLWITGWIVLLLLKSRPKPETSIMLVRKTTSRIVSYLEWLAKPFRSYPRLVYATFLTVIGLIITFGIISGNSYICGDCSYDAHSENIRSSSSNMTFTFEYPRCFTIDSMFGREDDYPAEVWICLFRERRTWFMYDTGLSIYVMVGTVESFSYFDFSLSVPATENAVHFLGFAEQDHHIDVLETGKISVAGILADYVTLYVARNEESNYWGVFRYVCFEYNGLIWVLYIHQENTQHEQYFDHILETFTITD